MTKLMIFLALLPIAIYLLICFVFFVAQDQFLYHPIRATSNLSEVQKKYPHLTEVKYMLPNGKQLYAWYQKPTTKKQIVLFTHGNSYNLNRFVYKIAPWLDKGYGMLAIEYEGFGVLSGQPSQKALEHDGKTAVKWLESQGYKHQDIILYGHSMGTYVATFLAAEMGQKNPFNAVVLDAPFLSLKRVVYDTAKMLFGVAFPTDWLIKDEYPTDRLIQKINTRLFVGHGKMDEVIPYAHGVQLFNMALKEKAFFSSDTGNHQYLEEFGFFDAVWKWLK